MGWGKAKVLFWFLAAMVFTIGLFLFSHQAKAAADHIVINEIYPNQISDGVDTEWAELYDPDGIIVNLSDYALIKITSSGAEYKKPLSFSMCPKSGDFYICDFGKNWLANSGATLVLRNNSGDIDRVTFGTSLNNAPVPAQGQSISRIPNGTDTDNDAADFQIVPTTKGSENILPPPVIYSSQISINELLPQPATNSNDEFIELYNASDIDVDLLNWQLDTGTFAVSTIIKAKEYRVFRKTEISFGLTDTGDTVNLIDPNGDIKSTVTYGKSKRGQSYSKFGDSWQWTTTLTVNATNILTVEIQTSDQDMPILTTDIAGARNQPDTTTVQIIGIVSVLPGVLSSQYFYIEDDYAGIQIYNYNKNFPTLSVGDQIQVTGELATYANERRIKISGPADIVILSNHSPPAPQKLTIGELGENFEGRYIQVYGVITKTSGSTFYIHGSGEIQVSIREGTGIKKPKMHVGDRVLIAGILSQYGDSYRILPIVQSDVKIISSSKLAKTGPGVWFYIIFSAILAWTSLQILYRKRKNWLKDF